MRNTSIIRKTVLLLALMMLAVCSEAQDTCNFKVKFRQLKLTCSNHDEENGRNAQVQAYVDSLATVQQGGVFAPPYTYQWSVSPLHIAPGDPTWAIGLQAFK